MGSDLDLTEAHVSIKNWFTQQPYITSDGRTSLDIPVESCEWTEVMYEAKVNEISTAKIVLPSLIAFPELRPLLQQVKEGDRLEIFNFQPDCGDPVFAGFIPPNGITEEDGKTILDVDDTLGQLRWQHIRRFEYLSAPASGLYDRARNVWLDLVAEDFRASTNYTGDYSRANFNGAVPIYGDGFVRLNASGTAGCLTTMGDGPAFLLATGQTYIMECDV